MPEWCTGTRVLVHWAAIAMFRMVAFVCVCMCVCVLFMHEYMQTCLYCVNENAIYLDCSGADELKGGWDIKEIDLQGYLT